MTPVLAFSHFRESITDDMSRKALQGYSAAADLPKTGTEFALTVGQLCLVAAETDC
jgi:hypothetical protein